MFSSLEFSISVYSIERRRFGRGVMLELPPIVASGWLLLSLGYGAELLPLLDESHLLAEKRGLMAAALVAIIPTNCEVLASRLSIVI